MDILQDDPVNVLIELIQSVWISLRIFVVTNSASLLVLVVPFCLSLVLSTSALGNLRRFGRVIAPQVWLMIFTAMLTLLVVSAMSNDSTADFEKKDKYTEDSPKTDPGAQRVRSETPVSNSYIIVLTMLLSMFMNISDWADKFSGFYELLDNWFGITFFNHGFDDRLQVSLNCIDENGVLYSRTLQDQPLEIVIPDSFIRRKVLPSAADKCGDPNSTIPFVVQLGANDERERNLILDQFRAFVGGLFKQYFLEQEFGCSDIEEHEYVIALTYAHQKNKSGQVERAALVSSKYRLLLIRSDSLMNVDARYPPQVGARTGTVRAGKYMLANRFPVLCEVKQLWIERTANQQENRRREALGQSKYKFQSFPLVEHLILACRVNNYN